MLPQLAIGGGGAQPGLVRQRQRLQADAALAQRDGFDKGHRRLLGLFQPASRAWRQRRRPSPTRRRTGRWPRRR
jgi:hypothetical protein